MYFFSQKLEKCQNQDAIKTQTLKTFEKTWSIWWKKPIFHKIPLDLREIGLPQVVDFK